MQTEVSEEHVDTNQKLKFYQPMRVSKVHQISNGLVVRDNMSTKICRYKKGCIKQQPVTVI